MNENFLRGRKLEFGDREQLGIIHHIDKLIESFLNCYKIGCEASIDFDIYDDLKNCQDCCSCVEYHKLIDEIESIKKNGIIKL